MSRAKWCAQGERAGLTWDAVRLNPCSHVMTHSIITRCVKESSRKCGVLSYESKSCAYNVEHGAFKGICARRIVCQFTFGSQGASILHRFRVGE